MGGSNKEKYLQEEVPMQYQESLEDHGSFWSSKGLDAVMLALNI